VKQLGCNHQDFPAKISLIGDIKRAEVGSGARKRGEGGRNGKEKRVRYLFS